MCLVAVSQNGCALEYIPEHHCTERVCLVAVTQNKYAIVYVPDWLRDEIRREINRKEDFAW